MDGNKGTVRHLADVMGLSISPDKDMKLDEKHNILCLRNTEYFFSGKEISDEETLERMLEYIKAINLNKTCQTMPKETL